MISMGDKKDVAHLHISLPLWVKELVFAAAEKEETSVSQYCAHVLSTLARDTIGIPNPPPAAAPIPSVSDVLRAYVAGEDKLIGPCGEPWPCEYDQDQSNYIGECEFCNHCGVRVH
jgi:hypothetical protein